MKPYANESEVVQIEGLTIENRADRISIYGEIDITRDKQGLKAAKELWAIIDATVKVLEIAEGKGELLNSPAVVRRCGIKARPWAITKGMASFGFTVQKLIRSKAEEAY